MRKYLLLFWPLNCTPPRQKHTKPGTAVKIPTIHSADSGYCLASRIVPVTTWTVRWLYVSSRGRENCRLCSLCILLLILHLSGMLPSGSRSHLFLQLYYCSHVRFQGDKTVAIRLVNVQVHNWMENLHADDWKLEKNSPHWRSLFLGIDDSGLLRLWLCHATLQVFHKRMVFKEVSEQSMAYCTVMTLPSDAFKKRS